jgi:hypothetical protein
MVMRRSTTPGVRSITPFPAEVLKMDSPVSGAPRVLLRLEGLALLVAATIGFHAIGGSWALFALLLLVPDVALIAYLAGPRLGALAYNAAHSYLAPAGLALLTYLNPVAGGWPICLIWFAHIGMDRALGLGLKFPSAFADTHLGRVGRVARTT